MSSILEAGESTWGCPYMDLLLRKGVRLLAPLLAVTLMAVACGDDTAVSDIGSSANTGATRPLALSSPDDTPTVVRSKASVALEDVVFDTFNGGSFTLAEGTVEDIARIFDAIVPIDAPNYESVSEVDWLNDGDVVMGYVDPGGGAWAYPVRILNGHEIVNDELGGQPVLISYCPLCGSGVVYDRVLSGQELSFSNTSALLDNDMVMVDRETGSYWWQVAGVAVVGELTDERLIALPSQTTTWESWTAQFPESSVMVRPAGRNYGSDSFSSYPDRLDSGHQTPFPLRNDTLADGRLAPSTAVVYATIGEETIAWNPEPARSFEEEIAGETVLVTTDGLGARVTLDGEPVATRSSFWFAALTVFPDLTLSAN